VCGFAWESVPDDEIAGRVRRGGDAVADVLLAAGGGAARRPSPERWSTLEYAAHVRDVCLHVRDRVVITLVEDSPEFKLLHPGARVDLGLYAGDDPAQVAAELRTAAGLFARTFERVRPEALGRPARTTYPTATIRPLRWLAQQVVHELEHHLDDVRENEGLALPGQ